MYVTEDGFEITKDEFLDLSKDYEQNIETLTHEKEALEKIHFESINNQKKR